ncbi:MAG: FHA domain-containing protein [Verrucomicrobiales bacterium]
MAAHLRSLVTGKIFALEAFVLIGRSDSAHIQLTAHGVSRQHATIRRDGPHFSIVDLGSSNGTYVNDLPVHQPQRLSHGDLLQFGSAVLVFETDSGVMDSTVIGQRTLMLPGKPAALKNTPATLLVADLKGYTALSASMKAAEVAAILSAWYALCRRILKRHGGLIDKFIGDCVFAYWHSATAESCRAALETAKEVCASTHDEGIRELLPAAAPPIECCVGLHVGEVALGSMGAGITTAVGDAVNVTFRIEALTRTLDCGVLASADFVNCNKALAPLFTPRGEHKLRGLSVMVDIFSLEPEC